MGGVLALKLRESDAGGHLIVFGDKVGSGQLHSLRSVAWGSLEAALKQVGSVVDLCSETLAATGCDSAELEVSIGAKAKIGWGLGGEADATFKLKLKISPKSKVG